MTTFTEALSQCLLDELVNDKKLRLVYDKKKKREIYVFTRKGFRETAKLILKDKTGEIGKDFFSEVLRNEILLLKHNSKISNEEWNNRVDKIVKLVKKEFGFDLVKVWKKDNRIYEEFCEGLVEKTRYIG